jgi:hypothetical protein
VAAGFEGDICSRTARQRTCLTKGNDFGVVTAVILVEALTYQSIVADEDAAYCRVRRSEAHGVLCLLQSKFHPLLINFCHG